MGEQLNINKNEKIIFTLKFLEIFNIYSNLIFLSTILIIIFNLWLYKNNQMALIIQILIHVSSVPLTGFLLFKGILISSTFKNKWKFYRITKKKIDRHGYKDEYFKPAMFEPCMRIVTLDILRQCNHLSRYPVLKKKYMKLDCNLEEEQEKLIKKLKKLGAESIEFN